MDNNKIGYLWSIALLKKHHEQGLITKNEMIEIKKEFQIIYKITDRQLLVL